MSCQLFQVTDWKIVARQARFQPDAMAALCCVSLRQLERFFQGAFACTPTSWLRALRSRLALELIIQGWSNKAIASELNYWDEPHFCREFKKVYGAPPQSYAPRKFHDQLSKISATRPTYSAPQCVLVPRRLHSQGS